MAAERMRDNRARDAREIVLLYRIEFLKVGSAVMGVLFHCVRIFIKAPSRPPFLTLRRFYVLLCMMGTAGMALGSDATALRPLASPDFSGFYSPTSLNPSRIVVDDVRGWIYFYDATTHVKGVRTSGIFRTSLAGAIDYSWLPQNVKKLRSVAIADNGDLLAMVEPESVIGPLPSTGSLDDLEVVRIPHSAGVPAVTTYRLPVAQPGILFDYLLAFTADTRWLYVVLRGRLTTASGQSISQTHLKRFSVTDQSLDASWGLVFDGQATLVGLHGGGLYLTYSSGPSSTQPKVQSVVKRVALAPGAAPSWTGAVDGMYPQKVLIDSTGRVYLTGNRSPNIQPFLEIHRFTATGEQDPTWSAERANSILPPGGWIANAVLVNQRLAVTTDGGNVSPPTPPPPSLVSFDDAGNGRIVRQFGKDYRSSNAAPFPNRLIVGGGQLLSIRSQSIESLNQETFETQATYVGLSTGVASTPQTIRRHADGTTTMIGRFSVWYEGQEFRNFIRYDANGIPDFNSRLGDSVDGAFNVFAGVSARGEVVLTGARDARTGALGFYVTATAHTAARTLEISGNPGYGAVGASAADSVWLYFIEAQSAAVQVIRRASIATGTLDPSWEIKIARTGNDPFGFPRGFDVDTAGGIWLTHYENECLNTCFFIGLERFSIANPTVPPYRLLGRDVGLELFASLRLQLNSTHAYTGRFRHRLSDNMVRDAEWETAQPPRFVDDRFAYFVTYRRENDMLTETLIERASLTGKGEIDALWQQTIPGTANLASARTDDNGNFSTLIVGATVAPNTSAIYTDQNLTPTQQTVIEFYSGVANRYFITGRAAEQALLDQYPAVFQRTGMRVDTLSAPFLSDLAGLAQPTCRYYFGPARGGSNSHFYGTGQDCAIANTLKNFAYEGLDFAALRPAGGVCSGAHPVSVTRLFNNRVATNEGNHRYVVGTRVISAMLAAGWINEGVVFCAARATEAVN